MSNKEQQPSITMLVKGIQLDNLMAINACNNGDYGVALEHMVSAQRSINALEVITVKVDEVMSVLEQHAQAAKQ